MDKVAIIAAAGWKGVDGALVECPVPFLPLVDGTAPLERLSKQLSALSFYTYVAVGPLGYPYRSYQPRGVYFTDDAKDYISSLRNRGVDPDGSPWTEDRHTRAASCGELLIMPDPGWANQHDTFCRAMDSIDRSWDLLLLICGDTLFSTEFLKDVMELSIPFQFDMCSNHAIFVLDKSGAQAYRAYAEWHRKRAKVPKDWVARTTAYPDGSIGQGSLSKLGIRQYGWHSPKWKPLMDKVERLWLDIDIPANYRNANERIGEGWYV